jgi:hypothetical protein
MMHCYLSITRKGEVVFLRKHLAWLALAFVACLLGCSNTKTTWEVGGDYQALVTLADSVTNQSGTVYLSEGIQVDHEVKMCDVQNVTWGFGFSTIHQNDVAAVRTSLPQALCIKGTKTIASGTVLTYQPVNSDTLTLGAQTAAGWTVTGTMTVDQYLRYNVGEPAVHQRLLQETSKGTFAIEAHGPNGEIVKFENGTYQFDIYVRKDPYDPFD